MEKRIKVCAFSDIHGRLDFEIEPVDIVLICGDIVPLYYQNSNKVSKDWLIEEFIPWCNSLPCEHVFLIAGNHDWLFQNKPDDVNGLFESEEKITYLNCDFAEYNGITIYGTPLCHVFGNWAFMIPDDDQRKIYDDVVSTGRKIDILMSHDAPYGVSDVLMQKDCPWATGDHIGNKPLAGFIEKTQPKIVVKGHLHSTNREPEYLNESKVLSVSLLDEDYRMVYNPQYFTI